MSQEKKLLGDRTADALRQMRLDRLAKRYAAITGKPCNCGRRKEALNNLHRKFINKD